MKKALLPFVVACFFLTLFLKNATAAEPSISVSCSPSCTTTYPTNTTISCARVAGDPNSNLTLWRDDHIVATGFNSPIYEINILQAGVYNYGCNISATENYTEKNTDQIITISRPLGVNYIVLNATNNTGLGQQFVGDYGIFENDTWVANEGGNCGNKGHNIFLYMGRSNEDERPLFRWNFTALANVLNISDIISARIYLYRQQEHDDTTPPYTNPFNIGVYEVSNPNSADEWNEYTIGGCDSPCGIASNTLNASCNSTALSFTNINPNSFQSLNSSLSWSWDVTKIANYSYFNKASKSFSVIFSSYPIDIGYAANQRWFPTSKENGTITTYPQRITVPQLVLVYSSTGYNSSKLNQSLSLSFSPSTAIGINTTLTASCARVAGDPNSILTLVLNSSVSGIPFSETVANGTTSPQYQMLVVNASGDLTYTCYASETADYNSKITTGTVTIFSPIVGAPCSFTGSRCFSNYTGTPTYTNTSCASGWKGTVDHYFNLGGDCYNSYSGVFSTYWNETFNPFEDSIFSCVNGTIQLTQQCFSTNMLCTYTNETNAECNVDAHLPNPFPAIPPITTGDLTNFMFTYSGIVTLINFMVSTAAAVAVKKHLKPEYALKTWVLCFSLIAFFCSIYVYPTWLGVIVVAIEVLAAAGLFVKFGKGIIGM